MVVILINLNRNVWFTARLYNINTDSNFIFCMWVYSCPGSTGCLATLLDWQHWWEGSSCLHWSQVWQVLTCCLLLFLRVALAVLGLLQDLGSWLRVLWKGFTAALLNSRNCVISFIHSDCSFDFSASWFTPTLALSCFLNMENTLYLKIKII